MQAVSALVRFKVPAGWYVTRERGQVTGNVKIENPKWIPGTIQDTGLLAQFDAWSKKHFNI